MGTFLEDYYNKFNEEKRLTSRHGQIEFRTSIHYIHECIEELKREGRENIKIMDIGAGTGRYSVALIFVDLDDPSFHVRSSCCFCVLIVLY